MATKKVLEKHIQKSILDLLKLYGFMAWNNNTTGIKKPNGSYIPSGNVGASDIFAIKGGMFHAIEVKKPGCKPTVPQMNFLKKVNDKGCIGIWMDNPMAIEVLDKLHHKSWLQPNNIINHAREDLYFAP